MKNKILTIIIIFILITFVFISNCFAYISETITSTDGKFTYKMGLGEGAYNALLSTPEYTSGEYNYFVFLSNGRYYFYFIPKTTETKIWLTTTSLGSRTTYGYSFNPSSPSIRHYSMAESSSNVGNVSVTTNMSNSLGWYSVNNVAYVYTDISIYTNSSLTDFFFKTPVTEQPEEISRTVLSPMLEKVEMKEPIIATIVGLAKLLIPLLICLLGFWKAWLLLLKILRKA